MNIRITSAESADINLGNEPLEIGLVIDPFHPEKTDLVINNAALDTISIAFTHEQLNLLREALNKPAKNPGPLPE